MSENMTLKERIADGVRDAIIKGDLVPGARLQEVEIAQSYETSRTPVREAFHQLESEEFLTIRPRRGAIVRTISSSDVKEFYELKSVLEGYAARIATVRLSEEDIRLMELLNQQMSRHYEAGNTSEMINAHNQFHDVFVKASGNSKLVEMLESLMNQFKRCRISLSHTESIKECMEIHEQIIAAFKSKNAELAEALVSKNSHQGSDLLVQRLRAA